MTTKKENTFDFKHPNKRLDLVAYLEEILSMKVEGRTFDIDNIYHFFFDDTDLHPNAEAEIGWFLRNAKEAQAIDNLTSALDKSLKKIGDVKTEKFTSDCEWSGVVKRAKDVLELVDDREKGSESV